MTNGPVLLPPGVGARSWLTLAGLEAFDQQAARHVTAQRLRFCCPLPACLGKERTAEHRSLSVDTETGAWHCHRCGASGRLEEYRTPPQSVSLRTRARRDLTRALAIRAVRAPTAGTEITAAVRALYDQAACLTPDDPAAQRLAARGIPFAVAAAAGVRYAPRYLGGGAASFGGRKSRG